MADEPFGAARRHHGRRATAGVLVCLLAFYALVALFPESDEAIVVAANTGTEAEAASLKVVEALRSGGADRAGETGADP